RTTKILSLARRRGSNAAARGACALAGRGKLSMVVVLSRVTSDERFPMITSVSPASHVAFAAILFGATVTGISVNSFAKPVYSVIVKNVNLDNLTEQNKPGRGVLWCDKQVMGTTRTPAIDQTLAFNTCYQSYLGFGYPRYIAAYPPPRVQPFTSEDIPPATKKSKASIAEIYTTTVCNRIRKLFNSPDTSKCKTVEYPLGTALFFELFSEPDTTTTLVTIKIFGKSIYLAARQNDYWELHRISFQFLENTPQELYLIISLLDSRMEKNRNDVKYISFDKPIDPSYETSVKEFLNRIAGAFSD